MAKAIIVDALARQIEKTFKEESSELIKLLKPLENSPYKGKPVDQIGELVIKEIFIVDRTN